MSLSATPASAQSFKADVEPLIQASCIGCHDADTDTELNFETLRYDKPYDEFVREQIAGDEQVDWRSAERFTPEIRNKLVATGFLRTAADFSGEGSENNIPSNHYAVIHDTLDIVATSLLGLTLKYARCHSHKFDPIPHEDYYRLMACLTPACNSKNWKAVADPFHAR